MAWAGLVVRSVGPLVTIQDRGRRGFLRFGVPASGPMDRDAFEIAHAALGCDSPCAAIEVSLGGLALECVEGAVTLAVAGGGFSLTVDKSAMGSWTVVNVRAGSSVTVRPGSWGSWAYLAFAGRLKAKAWLGSVSTHALSGLGGGTLTVGQTLEIEDAELREERAQEISCPAWARPRAQLDVVFGPQDRFFSRETRERLISQPFTLTEGFDRMGVRLSGPSLTPDAMLDMPSEPIAYGSIQVSGDGVPTVLLADHQTTGGYPKIATVVSDQIAGLVQHRSRSQISFRSVAPEAAVRELRIRRQHVETFLASLRAKPTKLLDRLMSSNLIDGVTSGESES
jgi:biotin-dependent carboxylase-like uncharacterized protein